MATIGLLGKREARPEPRMAALHDVVDRTKLGPAPLRVNWRADLPAYGVSMLGNDKRGCCFWATVLHYLELTSRYALDPTPLVATEDECTTAYASTGYVKDDPVTDNGTYVMGPGGGFEYWTRYGVMCGGELNKVTSAVTVDHRNVELIKLALSMGPLFCGAMLVESDLESSFLWNKRAGRVKGGHEFMLIGYDQLSSGYTWFDIETWDGLWRCSAEWLLAAADEIAMVFNDVFFDKAGISPAGVDRTTVANTMRNLATA